MLFKVTTRKGLIVMLGKLDIEMLSIDNYGQLYFMNVRHKDTEYSVRGRTYQELYANTVDKLSDVLGA